MSNHVGGERDSSEVVGENDGLLLDGEEAAGAGAIGNLAGAKVRGAMVVWRSLHVT